MRRKTPPKDGNTYGMYITGGPVDRQAVTALAEQLIRLAGMNGNPEVIKHAMDALVKLTARSVEGLTVSGCHISTGKP